MTLLDAFNIVGVVVLFFSILFSPFAIAYVFIKIMKKLGMLN